MTTDRLSVGCQPLDALLDGGLDRGAVTQFYGPPAAGKTNIALSAAVNTAAAGQPVLYIDTEDLSPARLEQVASSVDADDVLQRVHITEARDFETQKEAVESVESIDIDPALVILDSATGHYRLQQNLEHEQGESLRTVASQIAHLLSIARRDDIAVLITNQVYTDPEADRIRPLGGHTLEHWSGTIVRLERFRGGNRRATVEKHRSQPAGDTARFRIVADGLEGVEDTP